LQGSLIISLDFELYWGVRDRPYAKAYIPCLVGARAAIPAILEAFARFGIHATWATVGFLFCDNGKSLREHLPRIQPQYAEDWLSPYCDLPPIEAKEDDESIWFAPSLIRRISGAPNQEIATHTFSHYYCIEPGNDEVSFREDLRAACEVANRAGLTLRSLVFPRNQCAEEYLEAVNDAGITSYRGNPSSWFYQSAPGAQRRLVARALRLADAYVGFSGGLSYPEPSTGKPVNIPASRFLRPYRVKLHRLEMLRLRRIKQELTYAAKRGLVYHLWWHPHNFGLDTARNIAFLSAILGHYRVLHDKYGMTSKNMAETSRSITSVA
jgi:peptidoglycan/xylan/chitin deacetylase (PgdA/CDA1 family)